MLKLSGQLAALLAMLFCSSLQAQQQSATFYAFLKSEGIIKTPEKLGQVIYTQQTETVKDTCIIRTITKFIENNKVLDTLVWAVCVSEKNVEIKHNDSLMHRFSLRDSLYDGMLFGRKARLVIKKLPDTLNPELKLYQISQLSDMRNWLIYNANNKETEAETQSNYVIRALKGFVFDDMIRPNAFSSELACEANHLVPGDKLQMIYKERRYDKDKKIQWVDKHLTEYTLVREGMFDNLPAKYFSFTMTDLEAGTQFSYDTLLMFLYPEGIFLGNQLGLPFQELKPGIRCSNPADPEWVYYIFPMEEVLDPLVESTYHYELNIQQQPFTYFAYWNSILPARITWLKRFPIPWRDYEDLRGEAVFLQMDTTRYGLPYQVPSPDKPHFSSILETKTGLNLEITCPDKGKFQLELSDMQDSTITITPAKVSLKAGKNTLSFAVPGKQPELYYKLKLFSLRGKEPRVEQEYIFRTRYFRD